MSTATANSYDGRFDGVDQRLDKMDKRFDEVDVRFEEIDQRFEKVDQQFDKLTAFMIKRFDRLEKALETKADKVDLQRLYNLSDSLAKRQEICDQERLVIGHQLERHDRWIRELAGRQAGYTLTA